MRRSSLRITWLSLALCGAIVVTGSLHAAEPPSVKLALSFRPVQKDVEIDVPKPAEQDKCQVKVERNGKASGWVVMSPTGQVLRRFVDSNGDNFVDQWKYYKNGIEVYRDLDTNNNNKVDQSRWLNTAGTRWGLDTNEDGRLDAWKVLSAEEASREAVRALVDGDEKGLGLVLINKDDVRELGIAAAYADKLLDAVNDPEKKMREAASKSKLLGPKTNWMRFDTQMPFVIPADDGKAEHDLNVYANGMAIVEADGKPGLIQIGEMVRVGDVWKITQIPQPIEGDSVQVTVHSVLMEPSLASATAAVTPDTPGLSAEVQKLLEDLQQLDKEAPAPTAGATAVARYNAQRADLMAKLVEASSTEEEKLQWMRQLVDGLAAAVQFGAYPDGLKRLKGIESEARRSPSSAELLPYVSYRRLLAEYYTDSQAAAGEKQHEVQQWWRKELEKFAEDFPDADDTPEAMLQLAIAHEFNGKPSEAREWYEKLAKSHGDTKPAQRAEGALRRLDIKGKPFEISAAGLAGGTIDAKDFRGKVVLVVYWATWCTPCTQDIPVLRALYEQYRDRGFEILGVNLDTTAQPVGPYLKEHKVTWPQIHEPGGLESGPATSMGVIVPPVMFLVNPQGVVVSPVLSVDELKTILPDLLKKK